MNTNNNAKALHPVHACNDGVFNTPDKIIDLINPTVDMVDPHTIANSLSKLARFGGHTIQFYSVAQHSVLVAHLSPVWLRREALMHDAAEAFIGDIVKPLKNLVTGIAEIESRFMKVIIERYGLSEKNLNDIKPYDSAALQIEHEIFQKNTVPGGLPIEFQYAWTHETARAKFVDWMNTYDLIK